MKKKKEYDYFTVKDSKGNEIEYEILFTFESEDTNKSYIVYTDNETDKDGMIKTYASSYTENDGVLNLTKIEDEKEWNVVEKILEQASEEMTNNDN